MSQRSDFAAFHDELRGVAREMLGATTAAPADWAKVAAAGWLGLETPEDCDGSGATFGEVAVVLEEMGRAATAGPYLGTAVLGVGALLSVDGMPDRDRLLSGVAAGDARLAVALGPGGAEVEADPPFRLATTDGGLRLTGTASFVADAPSADVLLLLAEDVGGRPVMVRTGPSALTVTGQPVLDATRSFGTVVADGPVAAGDVLPLVGRPDDTVAQLRDRAAVAVACDSLGLAAAMLDATVAYAGVRHQFDRPIGSFQAVKHACADMLVRVTVGRRLLEEAVAAVASGSPEAGTAAARAKAFVCEAAVEVVGAAMQLHGGIGYTWESGIHVYLKRAVLNRALAGSPAAHRRRVAAVIGTRVDDVSTH